MRNVSVGGANVLQRVVPVDQGSEPAVGQQASHVADAAAATRRVREVHRGARAKPGGEWEVQVLAVRPELARDVPSAIPEQRFAGGERGLADRVEDQVETVRVGREVLGRVVDDGVGAEAPHEVGVLVAAEGGDVASMGRQQLDRG